MFSGRKKLIKEGEIEPAHEGRVKDLPDYFRARYTAIESMRFFNIFQANSGSSIPGAKSFKLRSRILVRSGF